MQFEGDDIHSTPLRTVISELAEQWAAVGSDDGDHAHSDGDDGQEPERMELEELRLMMAAAEEHRLAAHAAAGRTALYTLLDELHLGHLSERLRDETMLSCFVSLEERPEFLASLKELGVASLPERQKLANALTKAKRAAAAASSPSVRPSGPDRTGQAVDTVGKRGRCLPAVTIPNLRARGVLVTAMGRMVFLNTRDAMLSHGHRIDGPVLRTAASLAALAKVHLVIPTGPAPTGTTPSGAEASADDDATDAWAFARAIGVASPSGSSHSEDESCPLAMLLTARHAATPDATPPDFSSGVPPPAGRPWSPCLPAHCHLLPSLDALATPEDPDDRPTVRRRLDDRKAVAVWRGHAADATSLRGRLVAHCAGHPLFDVHFDDDARAPRLSRRQQSQSRVLLLVDGRSWDSSWTWALASGCVLVTVGSALPPLVEIEPWRHYVPAAADLSDLDARVRWALTSAATPLAQNCLALYEQLHSPQASTRSLVRLFAALSKRVNAPARGAVVQAPPPDRLSAVTAAAHHSDRVHTPQTPDTAAFNAIRGWASLQVFLGHYYMLNAPYNGRPPSGLHFGGESVVMLFFLMSGYVMTLAYAGQQGLQPTRFWWRRMRRILPIYWLSIGLHWVLLRTYDRQCPTPGAESALWLELAAKAIFLQQWRPNHLDSRLNYPLWTMSVQAWFWALFPCVLHRVHRPRSRRAMIGWAAAMWAVYLGATALTMSAWGAARHHGWVHLPRKGADYYDAWLYLTVHCAPYTKLPLAVLGMLLGSWTLYHPPALGDATWHATANRATLSYVVLFVAEQGAELLDTSCPSGQWRKGQCVGKYYTSWPSRLPFELVTPPLFAVWLYALAQAPESLAARMMRWRGFHLMGNWSFAIYCLHAPLLAWLKLAYVGPEAFFDCILDQKDEIPSWGVLVAVAVIVLISAAAFAFIEEPLRRGPHHCHRKTVASLLLV